MKKPVHPAVATVLVVFVVAVAAYFIWKGTGPRTDGPSHPINMAEMMGKGKSASPKSENVNAPPKSINATGGMNQ